MGISLAAGFALASRMRKSDRLVYAIVGDGELQEGQVWEAVEFAAPRKLDNFVILVDQNGAQLDGRVEDICNPFDIKAKFEAFGCRAADISALGSIRGCGVVFNTVPARVFTERVLAAMEPDTLLIDLASRPGGVDFEAASRLDRRVVWALSLPGEAAPEAAGAAIGRAVMNILAERGRGA